ncbi:MAG: MbnP family copper-binding protein [Polyangiales bacterium]
MRNLARAVGLLLSIASCGDDDAAQPHRGDTGAVDAGTTPPDAIAVDAGALPDKTRPDPNAPPATRNGKKLYTVRFDSRAGERPFACGKKVPLGTQGTLAEPLDVRFYVHDVTLIRGNGERVRLELHQDERYQRDDVALLDFVDDTGKCLTGDADIRNVVHGYAPEQSDYTGVAFTLGVPADKNHLNAAEAPAPFNASGMWWAWSTGFKYTRIDVSSDVQPQWYFHAGAMGCTGNAATGFSCPSRHLAKIELSNYDPQGSLVVFDAARFYATTDITTGGTTPGCMSFPGSPACPTLFATLGLTHLNDATPGPAQTAFVLKTGAALVAGKGVTATDRKTTDPTGWPDPSYQRPAGLDIQNVSVAGGTRSHPVGDPRHGANCMRCHQEQGPGVGKFTAAGTLLDAAGKPAVGTKIEVFSADFAGRGKFENLVAKAVLDVDANGNFFTTAPVGIESGGEVGARVLGADGTPLLTMPFMQLTAACNNCHAGSARLMLP